MTIKQFLKYCKIFYKKGISELEHLFGPGSTDTVFIILFVCSQLLRLIRAEYFYLEVDGILSKRRWMLKKTERGS